MTTGRGIEEGGSRSGGRKGTGKEGGGGNVENRLWEELNSSWGRVRHQSAQSHVFLMMFLGHEKRPGWIGYGSDFTTNTDLYPTMGHTLQTKQKIKASSSDGERSLA